MNELKKMNYDLIAKVTKNISRSRRCFNKDDLLDPLPNVIGVKLTNRCNLRCKHCYEWNDKGYHHNLNEEMKKAEIDYSVLESVVDQTKDTKAMFYLWGGEPLIYSHIEKLLEKLLQENRYTIICTNALLLKKYYDLIAKFEDRIELLIALDGDEISNDKLRGEGNYNKVKEIINELVLMKNQGVMKAKVSVHTMISNENINSLYDFVKELDDCGIDSLLLCFPWYISEDTSLKMDSFYKEKFDSAINHEKKSLPSWHAYKYKIEEGNINKVAEVVNRIRNFSYKMNIQFQPDISSLELVSFLKGKDIPNCDKRNCFTVFSRMDILPNGMVTTCKHFPEFAYGDLNTESVSRLWTCEKINKFREMIKEEQMPVCSKCNNLYRHSYKTLEE